METASTLGSGPPQPACCLALSSTRSRMSRNLEIQTSRRMRKAVSLETWHIKIYTYKRRTYKRGAPYTRKFH